MLTTLDEFVLSLADTGVIEPEDFSRFLENLPAGVHFSDAESLARELQRQALLTFFQVREILKGKAKGLVFGAYVVLDFAGGGGMGCVYKARHRETGTIVALKTLSPAVADTPQAVERFQREVETCKRLVHPHIIAVLDSGQAADGPFLVMEYVEGHDLYSWVRQSGPLLIPQAVDYLLQAARGLQYVHERGVVHRDVKPSNLLLDQRGVVRVGDLGLVRLTELPRTGEEASPGRLTHQRQVLGTPDYMAPEQARDPRNADARSDIYSLGCTWHFLLTCRPPYGGDTDVLKLLAHRERPVPSLRSKRPHLSQQADAIFQKMLAKRPEDRFQSMAEVIAALETCPAVEVGLSVELGAGELAMEVAGSAYDAVTTAKLGAATVSHDEDQPQSEATAARMSEARGLGSLLPFNRFLWALLLLVLAVLCTLGFLSAEAGDPVGGVIRVLVGVLGIGSLATAGWLVWPKKNSTSCDQ